MGVLESKRLLGTRNITHTEHCDAFYLAVLLCETWNFSSFAYFIRHVFECKTLVMFRNPRKLPMTMTKTALGHIVWLFSIIETNVVHGSDARWPFSLN